MYERWKNLLISRVHIPCSVDANGTRLGLWKYMKQLTGVPQEDHEHYMKCSVCESYFDMRDLGQVVDHQHWSDPVEVRFSHATKKGKDGEVYVKGKRGMVTLREKKKESQDKVQR